MAVMVVSLETTLFMAFSFGRMLRTIMTVYCLRGQDRRCVECIRSARRYQFSDRQNQQKLAQAKHPLVLKGISQR
jgi:hypothetical protein